MRQALRVCFEEEKMQQILLVIQIIVAVALAVVVLMQRSDENGILGSGSSGGAGFMSGRGKANFFTRTTALLATIFMANSLLMAVLVARDSGSSLVDKIEVPAAKTEATKSETPPTPVVPKAK